MRTVAVIMPTSHSYQRGTLRGIIAAAAPNPDWQIELFPVQKDMVQNIAQINPVGLITHEVPDDWFTPAHHANLPLVSLYRKAKYPGAFLVTNDDVACGRLMARHLLDCGGRRFAFIGQLENDSVSQQRLKGFRKEITSRKLPLQVLPMPPKQFGDIDSQWQREFFQWLQDQPLPLAIGAYNDVLGYSVLRACRKMNIRVPEDVMVLGVDNDKIFCNLSQPALSSIAIPWLRVGAEAFRLLTQKIDTKRKLPHEVAIPPIRVVPRESTDVSLAVNEDVAAATKFIRANVGNPNLGVPEVIAAVAMSRSSLQRRFKEHLGRTILEQIQRTRLTQAKRLLVETGLPVKAIAKRVGFKSIERMAKMFQQDMEMSPREFRARFRYPTIS